MNEGKNSFYKDIEEKCLLVTILNDLELYRTVRPSLHDDLFFSQQAVVVWQVIRQIEQQRKEPSMALVEDLLQERDSDISVLEWALDPNFNNFFRSPDDLISILDKHYHKRRLVEFRNLVDGVISMPDLTPDELLGGITSNYLKLLNGAVTTTELEYADKTVSRLYDQIANGNELQGIPTGFKSIDDKVMGLKPGDLFVIGAQTSVGKTALALNIARNVACSGKEIVFFSLEMRPEKLYLRIAATMMGVPANRIANSNYWDATVNANIGSVLEKLGKLPIRMPPCEKFSVEKIVNVARQAHQRKPIDLLIIDYLQIINDPKAGENRASFISNVCSELKALAMSLGIPIIVLAQVNRKTNEGKVHKPELWHLKESGSIEQAADVVLLIHRNKYKKESEGYDDELGDNLALLRIVKNREGQCDDILVSYDAEVTQFAELPKNEVVVVDYIK